MSSAHRSRSEPVVLVTPRARGELTRALEGARGRLAGGILVGTPPDGVEGGAAFRITRVLSVPNQLSGPDAAARFRMDPGAPGSVARSLETGPERVVGIFHQGPPGAETALPPGAIRLVILPGGEAGGLRLLGLMEAGESGEGGPLEVRFESTAPASCPE